MTTPTRTLFRSYIIEEYHLTEEPYYLSGRETRWSCSRPPTSRRSPFIFKGPTGLRQDEVRRVHVVETGPPPSPRLASADQDRTETAAMQLPDQDHVPLVTIACHEDLTAGDLVGPVPAGRRDQTVWIDGPLTRAVKAGGICYLDEIVEARKGYHGSSFTH